MGKKWFEPLKSNSVKGKIFENDRFLDDILCEYQIRQEKILVESASSSEVINGRKEISGQIHLINLKRDITGNIFRIDLEDGESFPIVISSGDFINQKYKFKYAAIN